jgi:hypothetical protein
MLFLIRCLFLTKDLADFTIYFVQCGNVPDLGACGKVKNLSGVVAGLAYETALRVFWVDPGSSG